MVFVSGLERIAEELMGRRKWKLYQESMSRNYLQPLNNNVKIPQTNQTDFIKESSPEVLERVGVPNERNHIIVATNNNHNHQKDNTTTVFPKLSSKNSDYVDSETNNGVDDVELLEERRKEEDEKRRQKEAEERLKDWTPQTKCYFCVDGKLDSEHTAHGVLVINISFLLLIF